MSNFESKIIKGVDYDSSFSGVDSATETLQSIEYEHHEIHGGSHFYLCTYATFSSGQVTDLTVITPNTTKWSHFTFQIKSEADASLAVHEGATVNVTGSGVTVYNNDRNSATTSVLTHRVGDTFTGTGTVIYSDYSYGATGGGFITRDREIILKQNTTYIFRITNQTAANNIISYCGEWYEHTNKN